MCRYDACDCRCWFGVTRTRDVLIVPAEANTARATAHGVCLLLNRNLSLCANCFVRAMVMSENPSANGLRNRRRFPRGLRAFTLIEILMVVAALAIIAGVVVPQVTTVMDDARNAAVLKDLREFTFAIERYRMDHNGGTPDLIQNETLVQLMQTTDADGNLGNGPQYPYGPYLTTVPFNALNSVKRVFRVNTAPPAFDRLPMNVEFVIDMVPNS